MTTSSSVIKAGYMEDWVYGRTYSGTPQGGVVLPLLANIYLHELDQHMQTMKADFDKGRDRRPFPRYAALERRVLNLRRKIERLRAEGADRAEIDAALAEIKSRQSGKTESAFRRSDGPQLQKASLLPVRRRLPHWRDRE